MHVVCRITAKRKELELCFLLLETRMESLNSLFQFDLLYTPVLQCTNKVLAGRKKISLCFFQSSWLKVLSDVHLTDSFWNI